MVTYNPILDPNNEIPMRPLTDLNEVLDEVVAITTTSGSRFIGVNKGYDEKRQVVSLRRAGVDKGDFGWYNLLEIPEGFVDSVEDVEGKEFLDYMSDRRETHILSEFRN